MSTAHYRAVNGFSNKYLGWGLEDDDMYARITGVIGEPDQLSPNVGRYRALVHDRVKGLDLTDQFNAGAQQLRSLRRAMSSGRHATEQIVMKDGMRQAEYSVIEHRCDINNYHHYVIDSSVFLTVDWAELSKALPVNNVSPSREHKHK